jgi:hypothetical protein
MKPLTRLIGSVFILGILVWSLTINFTVFPAQAAIRQLEEAPGQMVYQSRQTVKDQQGGSWQAIAFKRIRPDDTAVIYLRLVGLPGTADIDHSQPLTLIDSMGQRLTAADVSHDMYADQTQMEPDVGQYDLQPILMQLELAIPLRLTLATVDQPEIILNVSPDVVEEWRSLNDRN